MDDITAAKILIKCLDLTSLHTDDNQFTIEKLCNRAQTPYGNTATVCIFPQFIPFAKEYLQNTNIKIATVVNFPKGKSDLSLLSDQVKQSLEYGADEIDAVFPYTTFLNQQYSECEEYLKTFQSACEKKCLTKIILETGELAKTSLIQKACEMSISRGINFIKTSTGKSKISATPEAANIILDTISQHHKNIGFKASGGIKTFEDAKKYLVLANSIMGNKWVSPKHFRIGASSLLDDLLKILQRGY